MFVCPEIWDALKVAAESDLALAQTIVDSAGIIVSNPDMTLCYDERGAYILITKFFDSLFLDELFRAGLKTGNSVAGAKYELPKYVLSEPTNLIRDG